jgi:hypothetical protein
MNIAESEVPCKIAAKMCGFNEATKKIMYLFTDSYHNLCMDKSELLLSELTACERLLKYTTNEVDKEFLKKEISQHMSIAENFSIGRNCSNTEGRKSSASEDFLTRKYFLICQLCFWCSSSLDIDVIITKCPGCTSQKLESIPISNEELHNIEC